MTYWQQSSNNWSEHSEWITLTPSDTAKKHLCFVQETGYFETKYPYFTEREGLASCLILFTLKGTGYLTYKGNQYTVGKNEAFFIDSRCYQKYWTGQHEEWTFLWVHIEGGMAASYYQLFSRPDGPVVSIKQPELLESLLRSLLALHMQRKTVRSELDASKLIVDILTELVKVRTPEQGEREHMPVYIRKLQQALEQNFAEKWTLGRMAKLAAVNKYQLAKEFKYYTGFSPNEYLINRRITAAKIKLKYTSQSIKEIAAEVGIENASHFINLFKNREGITPLMFRKMWG
ncbi:AraC family transcriptional regulator [Domibacillus indicus]|uniref:AraC family transcriptional regulator n=1 Tax=Domibacillus indicus TaxID=1437523 RepID=UPI000617E7E9|nr:AraC family transcriptional regulator [Domibacillus indicus]